MHSLLGALAAVLLVAGLAAAGDDKTDQPAPAKASAPQKSGQARPGGQGEKMKTCNKEATAKQLKGDDRRQFMSQCLKGDKSS
jgi:hypothetical protein